MNDHLVSKNSPTINYVYSNVREELWSGSGPLRDMDFSQSLLCWHLNTMTHILNCAAPAPWPRVNSPITLLSQPSTDSFHPATLEPLIRAWPPWPDTHTSTPFILTVSVGPLRTLVMWGPGNLRQGAWVGWQRQRGWEIQENTLYDQFTSDFHN